MTAKVFAICAVAVALASAPAQGGITLLHEFAGGANDGGNPYGSLTLDGSTLYGMTYYGGDSNGGAVFKMNADGTGFTLLHEFAGGMSDGRYPWGSLTLDGSTLYGMTDWGGDSIHDYGTVFKMNADGTGFALLHKFASGVNDGSHPWGNLTLDGSTLYGMTRNGGDSDAGTVFKMNADGTGFTLLREFAGGGNDGRAPRGSLTLDGSTLYGMSCAGGDSECGTVFKMNADGTGFALLHEFAGGVNDGADPFGNLMLDGSTLYGMAYYGGDNDAGTVFKMNADGTGFTLLHEFAGGVSDGRNPWGSLMLNGSTLYGMTLGGGDSARGTVFQMNTDGTGFELLHEFAGGVDDGRNPYGSLTLNGSTLYGMTQYGGDSNYGTVFSLDIGVVPEPLSLLFFGTGIVGVVGFVARRRMRTSA